MDFFAVFVGFQLEIEKEGLRVKASSARELNAALKALARYEENRFMREMGIKG